MITITKFNSDGSCEVVDLGAGHSGTLPFANIRFGHNIDNSVNVNILEVPCPFAGCSNVDYHPIGGGANPAMIQKLFLRVILRRAVTVLPVGQRNLAGALAFLKARIEASEGTGRFLLNGFTSEDDEVSQSVSVRLQ